MAKLLWRILVTLGVIAISLNLADRMARRGPPLPAVPRPNGYEMLLAIAHDLSVPQAELAELGSEAVRQLARTNAAALGRLPAAFQAESAVPLQPGRVWMDAHAEELKRIKRLAVAIGLQSRAATLDGNTNQAAHGWVDTIQLGQAIGRGGLLVDGITALTIETIGAASLRAQLAHLDAAFCRSTAQELERAEARRAAPEEILNTEKSWSHASFGLVSRVGGFLTRRADRQRAADFTKRSHDTTRRTRRLIVALATRAMELETGKPVAALTELVPGVLRAVPLDPASRLPLTDAREVAPTR